MSYADQGGMLMVDNGYQDQQQYDMYSGNPEYAEALSDQQYMMEPSPTAWSTESRNPVAGQLDDENHLQMEDMYGVQTRFFDITWDASLAECAQNNNNALWKLNPELAEFMKQIVTTSDRDKADVSDRAGNLENIIPLAATIVEIHNEHEVPIGINIPGFVPNTITNNGRFLWTIQPRTAPTQVNYKVLEPSNFFTQHMYENWRKCDIAQLDREIKFSKDEPAVATMRTDGLAFDVLIDAIMAKRFGPTLNAEAIKDAAQYSRWVEIDSDIARKVYDSIHAPLKDIKQRFMNGKDFHARMTRADGRPFDSPHGLVGSPINGVSTGFMDTHFRYTKKRAGIRLKFDYVLYD